MDRGELRSYSNPRVKTEHVLIPADYQSGITLVMLDSNQNLRELLECPELPELLPDSAGGAPTVTSSSDAAAAATAATAAVSSSSD